MGVDVEEFGLVGMIKGGMGNDPSEDSLTPLLIVSQ